MKVVAIITAAGRGKRVGYATPKQFVEVEEKPILLYTLEKFDHCPEIDEIIISVPVESVSFVRKKLAEWNLAKVAGVVAGGSKRQDSVYNGLQAMDSEVDMVAIHDGVRPFISVKKIGEVIRSARKYGAAILALPAKETIKKVTDYWVKETPDRTVLWQVQTPQVFRVDWIREAYQTAHENRWSATDDATLVERMGHKIRIIEGEERNIKITSKEDLILSTYLLKELAI